MSKPSYRFLRILDGGGGDLLFKKGLPDDRITWSAKAILDKQYHKMVTETHLDFLNAGSRIITTNNYAVTPGVLKSINQHENIAQLTKIAVDLAKDARAMFYKQISDKNANRDEILIAGSVPPLNESYRPDLLLPDDECKYYYDIIINTLNDNNVDIFLCETLSCFKECKFAMDILQKLEINKNKKCWISFTLNDKGFLRSKENIVNVIKQLQPYYISNNIEIISMNCSTPESIDNALIMINNDQQTLQLLKQYNINIGCYPNRSVYIPDNWSLEDTEHTPDREILTDKYFYYNFILKWIKKYPFIGMVGGCCGILPKHIKYIVDNIQNDVDKLVLSSYGGYPQKSRL